MNRLPQARKRSLRSCSLLLGLALLVARPACAELRIVSLPANDLVFDTGRHRIYASVPQRAGAQGNSVVAIDPETGAVGLAIPVGPDPNHLTISDDGRYLYVGLDGAGAVRRVDLRTQKADLQFGLGSDRYGPYAAGDLQVLPGNSHAVAIARTRLQVSPGAVGVAVYDDGVPRPKTTDRSDRIFFSSSPARLYGVGGGVQRMAVDASGVALLDDGSLDQNSGGLNVKYSGGQLYFASGSIADPEQRHVVGAFPDVPYPSLVLPDLEVGRVFFLSFPDVGLGQLPKLLAYDRASLQPVGSLEIPVNGEELGGFIRWGSDGLAFRTDRDQVALLRTRLRTPGVVSADLAVTGSVSANPAPVGGRLTYQIQVQNYGPDAEPGATLSSLLPVGASLISLASTQGQCSATGGRLTCDLGALPVGGRAMVTLVVKPTMTGPLLHTVTVQGQAPDPEPGNNTATQRTNVEMPVPCPSGSAASLPVLEAEVRPISLPARDLVYNPMTRRIYASVPSAAGAIGNSVVPIDPLTGAIGTPIRVGSEPGKLALSGDGHYLYVALDGAAAVRRVDVLAQTAGLQFPLTSGPGQGPVLAIDLQAVPGDPDAVAVVGRRGSGFYGLQGVTIYDDGMPRPRTAIDSSNASTEIQFSSSASRLYGYDGELSGFSFQRLAVDDLGPKFQDTFAGLVTGPSPAMRYDQGILFTTSGRVIDPETPLLLGTVPNLGDGALVAPNHAVGQLFCLTGAESTRRLRVYNSLTLLPLATIGIPNVRGHAGSLIRWGQEQTDSLGGLAFLTDAGQMFLLRLELLEPTDLTFALSSAALIGGSPTTATITLSRPAPRGGAVVLLSSVNPAAVPLPPSITVPFRAAAVTFTVPTHSVQTAVDVELTASYASVEQAASLRLLPATPPLVASRARLRITPGRHPSSR